MLALSLLIVVGFTLIAEGFDGPVPEGHIYFAMSFSVAVELLNMRVRKLRHRRVLHLQKKPVAQE